MVCHAFLRTKSQGCVMMLVRMFRFVKPKNSLEGDYLEVYFEQLVNYLAFSEAF